jgi:two-component system response regulator AtoC
MVSDMDNKKRILIVDDDETVRLSYRRSLADTPWDVSAAQNGDEALRAMQTNPSDVVLLDLRMPGADGLSVLGTIKRKWPDSEVVVITGYPSLDSAITAVRLGAANYAVKPVGPEEVVDLATAAMNRKGWAMHRVPDPGGPSAA